VVPPEEPWLPLLFVDEFPLPPRAEFPELLPPLTFEDPLFGEPDIPGPWGVVERGGGVCRELEELLGTVPCEPELPWYGFAGAVDGVPPDPLEFSVPLA
jgi:hypothetical protein